MQNNQVIEIHFSKVKMTVLLILSLGLIALGLWFIIAPPQVRTSYLNDADRVTIGAYFCMALGAFSILKISRNFFNNEPMLIIDNAGMTNNTKGATAKYISWADVEKAEIISIRRQSFIIFHVKNPEEYISNQASFLKRKAMQLDHKVFGGPITMNTVGLKISLYKLLDIINEKLEKNSN